MTSDEYGLVTMNLCMCRIKFTPAFELTNIVPPKQRTRINSVHKGTEKQAVYSLFSQCKRELDKMSRAPVSKKHQEVKVKIG